MNSKQPIKKNTKSKQPVKKNIKPKQQTEKTSNVWAIVSIIATLFPYILLLLFSLRHGLSLFDDFGHFVGSQFFWMVILYYFTIGIPVAIAALICGAIGVNSERRRLAITSLIIETITLIISGIIYNAAL